MSAWQFTLFRILFGFYLAIHFATLLPHAEELFGIGGLLPNPALNPTHGLFPTPLALPLPSGSATIWVGLCLLAAVVFSLGFARVPMSILLWFGWSSLFHRNNLIANPSIPYIGLLLLLCTLVPTGEPLSRRRNPDWAMPRWVFRCAWILLAAGYTFSAWTKLTSPSWMDGSAFRELLENPLARSSRILGWMQQWPNALTTLMTRSVLFAEGGFLLLARWKRSRPWIWLALVVMHLGIVLVINFTDLTFGMLMIHAFTFDPDWFPARAPKSGKLRVAYDGNCGICQRWIRFLIQEDRADHLRFVSLQQTTGQQLEAKAGVPPLGTLLVREDEQILTRSHALLRILQSLGGIFSLIAWIGQLFPNSIRDRIYDLLARHRYRVQPALACDYSGYSSEKFLSD